MIAITGGTGFVGRAVAALIRQAGIDVALLTRRAIPAKGSDRVLVLPSAVQSAVEAIVRLRPSAIIHLAARQSIAARDTGAILDAGLAVGAAAAVAASQVGVPFVHASSYWQYAKTADGAPRSMYVAAKLAMVPIIDSLRSSTGLEARELILYDTYGPDDTRDKVVPALIRGASSGEIVQLRSPRATIDLTYVDDVASAFLAAATTAAWPRVAVVRAPDLTTISSLVTQVRSVTGRPLRVEYTDPSFHGERKPTGYGWQRPPGWAPTVSLESGLRRLWLGQAEGASRES
ncbi:MAG: NAD(P)-dependent oxidoreductase [Actinomycetota bacterium]|nr:NAD(P)-dependent oxidoreductase [Actinomycetota bacterium]